jgi:virginiamycin B lyase
MPLHRFLGLAAVLAASLAAIPTVASAAAAPSSFSVPEAPGQIVRAPDGTMWFTTQGGIAQISASGSVRSITLPGSQERDVIGIAIGPDGAVWATEATGLIARVGADRRPLELTPPTLGVPAGIGIGPDGAVWFTDSATGFVTRVDANAAFSVVTSLTLVTGQDHRVDPPAPTYFVLHDGAMWFLQLSAGRVGRLTSAATASFVQLPSGPRSYPTAIATGPDGALWITEAGTNRVARVTTSGAVSEFRIPSADSEPRAIVKGPDNAMWFTEYGADRLARIDMAGRITEYPLPAGAAPYGLVVGPGNAIWYTMAGQAKIGRMSPRTATAAAAARRRAGHH